MSDRIDRLAPESYRVSQSGTLHRAGRCYGARWPYGAVEVRRACKVCLPHGAIVREFVGNA